MAWLERDLEGVSTLHALFRNVVCRVPEFHVLLADLMETDRKSIAKVLRLPTKGAGRPRADEFQFVALSHRRGRSRVANPCRAGDLSFSANASPNSRVCGSCERGRGRRLLRQRSDKGP